MRPEDRVLATLGSDASLLYGKDATVNETLAALDGAGLAHLACHGRFRSDSPLFSSLELSDGSLTALDLQRLRRVPDIFVLSSCDLAMSERHPGDELLGLAAALLGMGTRTIIASVVPVPDSASRRLMVAFHRALADGSHRRSHWRAARRRTTSRRLRLSRLRLSAASISERLLAALTGTRLSHLGAPNPT